jgi:mediator of RNA polymerase II transcription subunit 17
MSRIALDESSLAQDFISLLLSAARPAAGGASMSSALKAAVPTGSLAAARISPQQQQGQSTVDQEVAIGWKMSSLRLAGETLFNAADRLGAQTGSTEGFIKAVLKVRAGGWGIVQLPSTGDAQIQLGTLKVYYGFQKGESPCSAQVILVGSDYHDPGVGFLKESTTGELEFQRDPKFAEKKNRMMRVRIEKSGEWVSSFVKAKDYSGMGLSDVEMQLYKARDSLFDEELYHEVIYMLFVENADSSLRRRRG